MARGIAFVVALIGFALSSAGYDALAVGALVGAAYFLGMADGSVDAQRKAGKNG